MSPERQRAIDALTEALQAPPTTSRFMLVFTVLFSAWCGAMLALAVNTLILHPGRWWEWILVALYVIIIASQVRTLLSGRYWDQRLQRSGMQSLARVHLAYEATQDARILELQDQLRQARSGGGG